MTPHLRADARAPALVRTDPRPAGDILPGGHIPALDGVRGLAILLILAYHFFQETSGIGPATKVLARGIAAGWCGVDLFFVLSGFLITGILHDGKQAAHRFRNFYARRSLRIFPLYYGVLAAFAAILPYGATRFGWFAGVEHPWAWLGLYGTNILVAVRDDWTTLGHLWSLAVEEHFYLFWPAVIFWTRRETALRICVAMVVVAVATRAWMVGCNMKLAAYCLTACRMDALAMGSFLALAARGPGGSRALLAWARWLAPAGGAGLAALFAWRRGMYHYDPAVQVVGYFLFDVMFASGLILVVAAPPGSRLAAPFASPALRWLGRYSYGLYVYNSLFVLAAEETGLLPGLSAWCGSATLGRAMYVVLATSSTLAVSWVSWHAYEKHFLKFKKFFPSAATRPPEPARAGVAPSGPASRNREPMRAGERTPIGARLAPGL